MTQHNFSKSTRHLASACVLLAYGVFGTAIAAPPTPHEWAVGLTVRSATMADVQNAIGWAADGKIGVDRHDAPGLPPFSAPYLTLVFNHSNWGAAAGDYNTDYHQARPRLGPDQWQFEIRSSLAGDSAPVASARNPTAMSQEMQDMDQASKPQHNLAGSAPMTLTWTGQPDVLDRSQLVDLETQERIPATTGKYEFTFTGTRKFVWMLR